MATNITYKGSELASFSNNTKTLKTAGKYLEGDITVSASTVLGTTTVVPSETTQTISPASGQDGLSSVTVAGITNTYVGSSVPTQAATTITPSSATQTVTGQKYMTGDITVDPIPSQYIVPSGTYTISSVDSTNTFNVTNYASAKVTITDADSIAY